MRLSRRARRWTAVVAIGPLVLAGGCTSGSKNGKAQAAPPPTLTLSPGGNAAKVPISTEVGTATDGKITAVTLTDDKGASVAGDMRPDGSSWLPGRPLDFKRSYTAQVTATSAAGKTTTQTTKFTTMDKPDSQVKTEMYFESGKTYGVNMPVTVSFDPPVPKENRAAVQKRLLVNTDPPQPGTWSWPDDGKQVEYRAPDPWRLGTKISVRAALAGLPIKDSFGDGDHVASATIAQNKVNLEVDNKTKQMAVYRDDKLLKKIPVSLGKASTPSSSGKMVIMEKFDTTVFDTRGEPNGGYVVTVSDAQRLTWGGEFIHAAPWSEGEQGYTNTSHGCVNVSTTAADWLMSVTHVGDLVTVKGTEVTLDQGNGFTAWNVSWEEFARHSALPVPADLKPAPQPAPSASPAPSGSSAPSGSPGGT
ncbi:Ig-like domain-containing protein, partial [Micromonospora zhanjiangensis]